MRFTGLPLLPLLTAAMALSSASAAASQDPSQSPTNESASETRYAYLQRLTEVCAVECLPPRELRRKARKRGEDGGDMAVIMDVALVQKSGDRFELFNVDTSSSQLVDVEILGAAGINTSSSNGVGGLPRGRRANVSPDVVIVSLDKQALADLLNAPEASIANGATQTANGQTPDSDILVEAKRQSEKERQKAKPTLAALKSLFTNRRIVVRGQPVLTAQWIGGRKDYRRKQVTLLVANADDLVMLPRYGDDGEPLAEDLPWVATNAEPEADGTGR